MRILGVLFFIMGTLCAMAQTEVIAHRGYWKTDGSSQNSIRALVKADSIACYGSEFDVWLTADDVLVVNHDAVFKGVEIETSQSKDARAIVLSNGENLPSLKQYLQAGKDCTTRLVFELKPHKNRLQEAKAVIDGIMMVDRLGLNDRVEYITFSADALEEFIKYAPKGTPVYYLNGEKTPQELHKLGAAGMDYNIRVFKKHPEWIKECHDLGMKVNVWTVNKEEDMKWCIEQGVDFITTNEPELLQKLLKK